MTLRVCFSCLLPVICSTGFLLDLHTDVGSNVDIMVTSGDAVTLPVSGTGTSTDVASSVRVGPVTVWDEQVETGATTRHCALRTQGDALRGLFPGCGGTGRGDRSIGDGKGFNFEDHRRQALPTRRCIGGTIACF